MSYNVSQTTAEEIIAVTDAVLLSYQGANLDLIAQFLDVSENNAQNAANMAAELGLVELDDNLFFPKFPYANYLVTKVPAQKAAVLRFVLEEYEPYKVFKSRLRIVDGADAAAAQVKAIFNLEAHRMEIANTLISLGTYTGSLLTEGYGRYSPTTENNTNFISIVDGVINDRQLATSTIKARLGEEICHWVDQQNVLDPIITAYQRAGDTNSDPRSIVLNAGNAVESFLSQVATHYGVDITRATGINAKIERIRGAHHLSTKHLNMFKYLGHVRNACDHGVDNEIGTSWTITADAALEYLHVSLTTIRSTYDCIQGNYII